MALKWQVTLPATFASESRTMARGGDNFPVSGGSIPPAGTKTKTTTNERTFRT